jgi:hypothetical protein
MLCTRRERRLEEEPDGGVLEPDDELEEEDAVSNVERGRGSGGSETLASVGMLTTIMAAGWWWR